MRSRNKARKDRKLGALATGLASRATIEREWAAETAHLTPTCLALSCPGQGKGTRAAGSNGIWIGPRVHSLLPDLPRNNYPRLALRFIT